MTPLERYLREIGDIQFSHAGVSETSHYPAIQALLSAVGKTLDPKVRCVLHPPNTGAGIPDVALYTQDQLARGRQQEGGATETGKRRC